MSQRGYFWVNFFSSGIWRLEKEILLNAVSAFLSSFTENRTIIEDDYEIVEQRRDHIRRKREIVVDEEAETAYIDKCAVDTEKEYPFSDTLSRTPREIEWSSYAKTSKEYFVKVLVVADRTMVKYHVRDEDLEHYILTLMSHVSLLFKDASIGNAISVAVVNLAILKNNDFYNSNSQDMLRKFCEWQQRNIWQKSHDVALLLTRNTICKNTTAKVCTTLGVAEVGSICRPSSCAIVRDKGLSTSYTIAHELGHVLSMPHDEERKCDQYNKGFEQNNIMNKMLKNDTKPFMWSPCSRHIVTEFLDSKRAKCLNNPPTKDWITSSYTKILPGENFEVDRQCELHFGAGSKICSYLPPCQHLWCTENNNEGCRTQYSPWAEGTKCGDRSWCFHRQCIPQNRQQFTPIDGGWGPWQDWGPCSRSCGGGIQLSQRYCDSPEPINGGNYCIGENVRYASCNTMDCDPSTEDFRAIQCAEFNGITKNLPNLTNRVEWVPKYGLKQPEDMCKLYCRPKDSNAYYVFKEKVIDGTKCGLTSFDICVNGECRPGGCDNRLESSMGLDECGVCGGDNSGCQEITGTYNKLADTSGYNKVATIPKGSSNINITQNAYPHSIDENYLVLIDGETDKPILNGNYLAVTHESDVVFGSVIIKYSGTNATMESITTPKNHKLTRDLILAVLSVGKLTPPNIVFRYVIDKDQAPRYGWRLYQKQWSKCTSICEGKQYRKPVCVDLSSGNEVPISYCDVMDDSVIQKQECNTHCELTWNIASKSVCSSPCGKGYRRVYYNCMKVYKKKPNYSEIVNDKHCSVLAEPPRLESCISVCNSTRWDYSPWSECTKTCGGGIQRRTAKCVDDQYTPIDDSYCSNSQMITEQICNVERCPSWILADTSPCSAPCGGGYRNLTYYCVLDGRIYEKSCDINTRPPTREVCNEQACGRWAALDSYHKCSVTCGKGIERRQFACKKFNSEEVLHEDYCRDLPIPSESRECFTGNCDNLSSYERRYNYNNDFDNSLSPENDDRYNTFMWSPGKWSACSQTCDGGVSTQTFHCINDLGNEDQSKCIPDLKPNNVIQCNNKPCPKWKTSDWSPSCDSNCEKYRQVICMDYTNTVLQDYQCDLTKRPINSTKCKLSDCSHVNTITSTYFDSKEKGDKRYRWKVGNWKQCSNTCGKGTRRRHIECEDSLNDITVVDSLCKHLKKPKTTKPCERYACKYAWIESYWSTCSASCGYGTKTRNVTCHRVHHGGIIDPNPLPDIYTNKIHHKNYCSIYNKPATETKCIVSYCGDEYIWQAEPWKQCSQNCGRKGRQMRVINCISIKTKQKVSRHLCRRNLKPPRKRKCNQRCLYKSCKEESRCRFTATKWIHRNQKNISLYIQMLGIMLKYMTRGKLINIRSCPYNGQRKDNCPCDRVSGDRSGFTNFWKVRLNITSMKIIGDDFTFSKQIKGTQITYGTAGDCYSSVRGCAQGRFSIDLTHTSFKLAKNVRWEELGSFASSEIQRRETVVYGKCGGYCGNCIPDPDIGLAVEIT
ncbi:hypothetical protein NQ315_013647 [Exocentrus adspersus]|uniref:A disintegrin and metalloproteinase with thrombospondin motifs 9 n=1 Tax=Exocentrus adspersus TaxID=1586481 RepID=A0AAV8W3M3_9CUCU|nr:hypothetical protein NQ315_013647 [Exocentrus adspersus]